MGPNVGIALEVFTVVFMTERNEFEVRGNRGAVAIPQLGTGENDSRVGDDRGRRIPDI